MKLWNYLICSFGIFLINAVLKNIEQWLLTFKNLFNCTLSFLNGFIMLITSDIFLIQWLLDSFKLFIKGFNLFFDFIFFFFLGFYYPFDIFLLRCDISHCFEEFRVCAIWMILFIIVFIVFWFKVHVLLNVWQYLFLLTFC